MLGLSGVRIEVVEVEGEEKDERRLVFRESKKVVSWLEYQESLEAKEEEEEKSKGGKRGVARAVEKAGAWWRRTWESNKAATGAGGFM